MPPAYEAEPRDVPSTRTPRHAAGNTNRTVPHSRFLGRTTTQAQLGAPTTSQTSSRQLESIVPPTYDSVIGWGTDSSEDDDHDDIIPQPLPSATVPTATSIFSTNSDSYPRRTDSVSSGRNVNSASGAAEHSHYRALYTRAPGQLPWTTWEMFYWHVNCVPPNSRHNRLNAVYNLGLAYLPPSPDPRGLDVIDQLEWSCVDILRLLVPPGPLHRVLFGSHGQFHYDQVVSTVVSSILGVVDRYILRGTILRLVSWFISRTYAMWSYMASGWLMPILLGSTSPTFALLALSNYLLPDIMLRCWKFIEWPASICFYWLVLRALGRIHPLRPLRRIVGRVVSVYYSFVR